MIVNSAASTNNNFLSGRPSILIVEDDELSQISHTLCLQGANYNVHIAANGAQAIEAFLSKHFDLVLLDIQLPDMSGIEVNKTLRKLEKGNKIPIVAFTALGQEIYNDCIEAGINEVIIKPALSSKLRAVLAQILS